MNSFSPLGGEGCGKYWLLYIRTLFFSTSWIAWFMSTDISFCLFPLGLDMPGWFGTASTYPFLGFAVNTTGAEFQGGARIGTAGTPAIVSPESFITLNGSPSGTSFTTNDVLQFALDMDNGKMWIGKNGTWMNSGVPASGTGNMFSISDTSQYVSPYIFSYDTSSVAFNFGQRAFKKAWYFSTFNHKFLKKTRF